MNRRRKVLITTTYNEMGIIVDTNAEEVARSDLQPTCNQLATDCISRKVALDGIDDYLEEYDGIDENGNHDLKWCAMKEAELLIKDLPSVQPEITDEQAIGHLQASGWMQSHDKQMYEMGLKERLADDSDSYDALLPSSQQETNCSEFPNSSDIVSRKAVRDMVATWSYDMAEWEDVELALHDVDELPPAQPEVIHCMGNCPIKPNGYLAEAAQMVLNFIRKCEGNDAYITTPDGERLSSYWGYVDEGLEEIIRWVEGRKENGQPGI